MVYDFKPFDKKIGEIAERLGRELSGIRTGHAALGVLDGVQVESYGTRMLLNQVANISIEDARTLRIAPWDMGNLKEVEKAITAANLGLSVSVDERGLRVFFPELTSERRTSLVKLAKERVEEARATLRVARDEVWSHIQKLERDGTMPEDDKFRSKDEMQKKVDAANAGFDSTLTRKEKEMTT